MTRSLKLVGGAVALMLVLVAGLYGYRRLMLWEGRTPEGYQMLTIMPGVAGFEPASLPAGPVLENQSTSDLAVNFGYKVGGIPYSYSLVLSFPAKPGAANTPDAAAPDAVKMDAAKADLAESAPDKRDEGRATVTVRHATRSASVESIAVRRWDDPRKAFAVALQDRFDKEPNAPALCIKAVIGPSAANYDLKNGSLCIAQRDTNGLCHPETLACGLIRD